MDDAAERDQLLNQARALLSYILPRGEFPGRDELMQQTSRVQLVGGPLTMLELSVSHVTPPAACADGPIPLSAEVSDEAGASVGELLIWVEGGYLSALEFAWWTENPPHELPGPSRITVGQK